MIKTNSIESSKRINQSINQRDKIDESLDESSYDSKKPIKITGKREGNRKPGDLFFKFNNKLRIKHYDKCHDTYILAANRYLF